MRKSSQNYHQWPYNDITIIQNAHRMICDHSGQKLDQKKRGGSVCQCIQTHPFLGNGGGLRMPGVGEDEGWIWGLPSLLPTSLPPHPFPSLPSHIPSLLSYIPSLPSHIPPLPSLHPSPPFLTSFPFLPNILPLPSLHPSPKIY